MNTENFDLSSLPPDPDQRLCERCKKPLGENIHGNRKYHPQCYNEEKKERQKKNYKIGNSVKLNIQKNDAISAILWKMDPMKKGILKYQATWHQVQLPYVKN